MKKLIILTVLLSLFVSACGGSNSNDQIEPNPAITEIIGSWDVNFVVTSSTCDEVAVDDEVDYEVSVYEENCYLVDNFNDNAVDFDSSCIVGANQIQTYLDADIAVDDCNYYYSHDFLVTYSEDSDSFSGTFEFDVDVDPCSYETEARTCTVSGVLVSVEDNTETPIETVDPDTGSGVNTEDPNTQDPNTEDPTVPDEAPSETDPGPASTPETGILGVSNEIESTFSESALATGVTIPT